ncbi:MAG: acetyl-CoA carboxylase biotin carboxyl carrier protein [Ignavibacteriales bacterium]
MDVNLLKQLIKLVEKSEITEFSVQEGELKVKISKNTNQIFTQTYAQPAVSVQPQSIPSSSPKVEVATEKTVDANLVEVKSPIVGTFYAAPAPDADAYVHVGDSVSPGTVLCIVEAMKLMNEIESEYSGVIEKILVENATPVEYNQPLFLIRKS